jgi:hypothetical protein
MEEIKSSDNWGNLSKNFEIYNGPIYNYSLFFKFIEEDKLVDIDEQFKFCFNLNQNSTLIRILHF